MIPSSDMINKTRHGVIKELGIDPCGKGSCTSSYQPEFPYTGGPGPLLFTSVVRTVCPGLESIRKKETKTSVKIFTLLQPLQSGDRSLLCRQMKKHSFVNRVFILSKFGLFISSVLKKIRWDNADSRARGV